MNLLPLNEWFPNGTEVNVISGPCSAESREQVIETARALKETGLVSAFRAGVWKPRTRPGAFEGYGEPALDWMLEAKAETGFPLAVEVANAAHVELCLKKGIDILWIGARTSVNPFSVQEIADALKGADVPVFIKNPINPDLALWQGAIERINNSGINKIAAIHRGFSSFESGPFRNDPMWELPIKLKRQIPNLPIFCDPSHICGNRELLPYISQKAMDLNMQGLMLESHPNPEIAMTDAKQQVTPANLVKLIKNLSIREATSEDQEFTSHLEELREKIDELDKSILIKLSERMNIVEKIGEYKRDNKVTILQVNRWDEIVAKRTNLADALALGKPFVEKLLELIHGESIRKQTEIMNTQEALKK